MRKPRTKEQFLKEVYDLAGNDYVVEEAADVLPVVATVKMKHIYCGYEWYPKVGDFINKNTRCPLCSHHRFTPLSYRKYVKKLTNGKIIVLTDYSRFDKVMTYKCLKHNYIFYRTPISFRRSNYRCKLCKYEHISKVQRKDNETFLEELHNRHKSIKCLDLYQGTHHKLEFYCLACKNQFKTEPNAILRLSGCPFCKSYHGEDEIAKSLKSLNIEYEYAKRFDGCRDKRLLHFDFYLPNLQTLIEYDGLQHIKAIEFFGGDDSLKTQQRHDKIKNDYVLNHNYYLYRIPYQNNISNIDKIINDIIVYGDKKYLVKG